VTPTHGPAVAGHQDRSRHAQWPPVPLGRLPDTGDQCPNRTGQISACRDVIPLRLSRPLHERSSTRQPQWRAPTARPTSWSPAGPRQRFRTVESSRVGTAAAAGRWVQSRRSWVAPKAGMSTTSSGDVHRRGGEVTQRPGERAGLVDTGFGAPRERPCSDAAQRLWSKPLRRADRVARPAGCRATSGPSRSRVPARSARRTHRRRLQGHHHPLRHVRDPTHRRT